MPGILHQFLILLTHFPCGFFGFLVEPPVFLLAFLTALSNVFVAVSKLFVLIMKLNINFFLIINFTFVNERWAKNFSKFENWVGARLRKNRYIGFKFVVEIGELLKLGEVFKVFDFICKIKGT